MLILQFHGPFIRKAVGAVGNKNMRVHHRIARMPFNYINIILQVYVRYQQFEIGSEFPLDLDVEIPEIEFIAESQEG